jgi:hypothetical protein
MNTRAFALPIVLFGFLATPLLGQEKDGRESSIRALEERERQAVLASDTDTLQKLWSPLMIVNNPQSTITPDHEYLGPHRRHLAGHCASRERHPRLSWRNGLSPTSSTARPLG